MTGPAAAHFATAVAVVGGGMLAGHVIAPYGPGAMPGRRLLFAVVMLALGAWRGQSESRARAEWNGVAAQRSHLARSAALGAVGALILAAVGYGVVHG